MSQQPVFGNVSIYSSSPSQGTTNSPPLVMLLMSNDHEMFKKSYSDNSDIDGDGVLDRQYNDDINYLGYFDSGWCYKYFDSKFEPSAPATGLNSHHCTTSASPWSGNFLNWATMTRIDLVRRVFFGGKRSTDTSTDTILERASLSTQLDAFAKVYNGTDTNNYTPYSGSITICSYGSSPAIRVARGSYFRWALTEGIQCQWDSDFSPSISDKLEELNLRVKVCVNGKDTSDSGRCKKYPNGNYKPIGLLQQYGEGGEVLFGLMSGTINNRKKGGVVRRNIGKLSGNKNSANDEVDLNSGIYNPSVRGIIYHMSEFYLQPGQKGFGNPIAEMYLDALRYFSGESAQNTNYNSDDSSYGLYKESWSSPINSSNKCASCSIIIISSTLPSFDTDDLTLISDLPGGTSISSINSLTDTIGTLEGLRFPGKYFYGGSNSICDSKNLTNLSSAIGICPSAPRQQGGYKGAGLSYYAVNNDVNSIIDGDQKIRTYIVQIENPTPELSVTVNGNVVSFSPVSDVVHYKSMTVESLSSDGKSGKFYFVWEDCEEIGCDNDFDASSSIEFCILDGCTPAISSSEIKITSRFEAKFTTSSPGFSYTISGTTEDGIYGIYAKGPGGGLKQGQGTPISKIYTVSSGSTSAFLPSPLQLMAKYGGFTDLDSDGTPNHDADRDGTPDDSREWDNKNNLTGSLGADGIPDNYFFSNNPALLEEQLSRILKDIVSRISAASNVALVSNSASGVGTAVQALFRPKVKEIGWVGLLNSLFIDASGNLREDTNGNDALDDFSTDFAVNLFFDASVNQTLVQRYSSTDGGKTLVPQGSTVSLDDLKPVWSAHEELMDLTNVLGQRTYSDPSNMGRYMFTWIDSNNDGVVGASEEQPLITSTFGGGNEGFLGVSSGTVDPLIKYIRGEDQPGYRSRSVDYDNDGSLDVWRLGDIIHSNPLSVSKPSGFYGDGRSFNPNDATFLEFIEHYKNRRQVIYVGGNDGLIHAFNAGFWDETNQLFALSKSSETSHRLGGEIWAYAPMNLLPHLQWLTDPSYPHVYYMDGQPLIFDANIFPDDADHPKGWGTVLVMGMGLGGGPIDVSIGGSTVTRRSAYVVMDITNPEKPPKVLAEITHPDMGFTTMRPELIQRRLPDSSGDYSRPQTNEWYLVFGSGPRGSGSTGIRNALDNATSDQSLKVFVYNLKTNQFLSGFNPYDTGLANSYSGDMSVVDWDNNNYDDAVYFGSVQTSTLSGQLMRINIEDPSPNNWTVNTFLDIGRPITSKPLAITNNDNERWVFSGTGRELIRSDSLDASQEYFFGVKEPQNSSGFTFGQVLKSDLIDTSDIEVLANGDFSSIFTIRPGVTVDNFTALRNGIKNEAGWINLFEHDGSNPSNKSLSSPVSTFALLLFTEYQPPADQCQVDGSSFLRAQHYQTGTAIPANIQRVLTVGTITDSSISVKRVALGAGKAPAPIIHQSGDGQTSVIIQGEAGNISNTSLEYSISDPGRQSWRQIHNIPR
ncbi:pilus assembly protein [Endozoicomonas atrinae]|uniref:pilus assembly protein n=1 Tax=Endozoicomonas atrinae TaxID=1333660 RepID=UPI001586C1DE|nr:PilC/PilY family type IV pilus protein [Endozoicomonas atrinae]